MTYDERVYEYMSRGLCRKSAEVMAEAEPIFEPTRPQVPYPVRIPLLYEEVPVSMNYDDCDGFQIINSIEDYEAAYAYAHMDIDLMASLLLKERRNHD